MPSKYCCVPKCYNKDDKCYRITEIKDAQKIWIERIGNPDLANLRHASSASICRKHFHADCIGTDGKLKRFALPTLNLPEYVNSRLNDDLFSYSPIASKPDSSRKMQDSMKTIFLLDEVPELKVHVPKKVYTRDVIGNELAGPSRHTEVSELESSEVQIGTETNLIEDIPTSEELPSTS
ncbi:uncharacterized protein LOC123315289 [Coccinella septempunctata]|uniref:uncharacterized protein LOC123315289 n=1 Tax=Coccinella septempunctata TaxID=41139 RepID=UPI001D0640A4|nr:uncharacterized protein LOC123315289 [Coccinella septempunctata]